MADKKKSGGVKFVRIRGKIVPIKSKGGGGGKRPTPRQVQTRKKLSKGASIARGVFAGASFGILAAVSPFLAVRTAKFAAGAAKGASKSIRSGSIKFTKEAGVRRDAFQSGISANTVRRISRDDFKFSEGLGILGTLAGRKAGILPKLTLKQKFKAAFK